jgi:gliding-associated putative ABC transporter substrate-binding component GldG
MRDIKTQIPQITILIAIIIFVNLISVSLFYRLDLSKGKIYSLSESSKNAVRGLEDRMVVRAYFTKNLPGEYADTRRYIRDLLAEYQAYSRGQLRFEFIDPATDEEIRQEAHSQGIAPVSMRVIEDDKFEVREVYLGMAFTYLGETETLPLIQHTRGVEYDITSTIRRLSRQELYSVAFYAADEEEAMPQQWQTRQQRGNSYQTVRQLIADHYEVIDTKLETPIDFTVDALIITGITDSLTQMQLANLDDYLMHGGQVLLFQDRVSADINTMSAAKVESNLFDLLQHYGIFVKANLVKDAYSGQIQIERQQGMFRMATPIRYPYIILARNLNDENLITKNLEQLQLVFASEIDLQSSWLEFEALILSSDNSGTTEGPQYDINYNNYMNQNLSRILTEPARPLGGIFSGHLVSYFSEDPQDLTETTEAKIMLVTDSNFLKDGLGAANQANLNFAINALDFMVGDLSLIEMRARETVFRPLKELTTEQRNIVKWLNILLPSMLLIIYGLVRYRAELKRRKKIGGNYA